METRQKDRLPYEEFKSSASDETESDDSKDEEWNGDKIGFDDDEFVGENDGDAPKRGRRGTKPKGIKQTAPKPVKIGWEEYALSLVHQNIRCIDDDDILYSPTGERCDFVPFEHIKANINNPDAYFPRGKNNINTLIPSYFPASKNILQYFHVEGQKVLFECPDILDMTVEELDAEIAAVTEELDKYPKTDLSEYVVVPPYDENMKNSIAIHADVTTFDFKDLGSRAQFDVIVMDPPWMIQGNTMTRGVDLGYEQMKIEDIALMDIPQLQKDGYLFMWVVSSTLQAGASMIEIWGYKIVSQINWIKTSRRGVYQPSNGYYLQHGKETCLVAKKGRGYDGMRNEKYNDLIIQPRNIRQSHKPEALYDIIEEVFPDGMYIEIFARAHNLREGWVSLGLEVPK